MKGSMMRLRLSWIAILAACWLSACGSPLPNVTPTVAPSHTPDRTSIAEQPSRTPIIELSATPTITPFISLTPMPTVTGTATNTPTVTATGTQSATYTSTASATFTQTATPQPSHTPSQTTTPTVTPFVLVNTDTPTATLTPSATPSATLTHTPVPSVTPSPTATPTATATPTLTATRTPDLAATRSAQILQTQAARPTFTAVPEASATVTLPPPTLAATPTFVTATPVSDAVAIQPTPIPARTDVSPVASTPIVVTAAAEQVALTATPYTPTPLPPEQIPATLAVETRIDAQLITPAFDNTNTGAYQFNVSAGSFVYNGVSIGGSIGLFVPNPIDAASYVRTDTLGLLSFIPPGGGSEQRIAGSPYTEGFGGDFTSPAQNKNFVDMLVWAPNGRRMAFIINPPAGTDNVNAGVWFYDVGSKDAFALLRDCPQDGYNSCTLVPNRPAQNWRTLDVEWSPDSGQALLTVWIAQEGRQALVLASAQPQNAPEAPPFLRFDNAQWLNSGQLLVSGRAPDGRSLIAVYNLQSASVDSLLFDATASGLFIFDAFQRPNGEIVALGNESGFGGALRLYHIADGQAIALSGYAGEAMPQRIRWAANGAEVVLTIGGQQFAINSTSGAITQPSTTGSVTIGASSAGSIVIPPSGVIAGSRYSAGQIIRFVGDTPRNMRTQPQVAAPPLDLVLPGEFVTVLAGPFVADGYEWWLVSNARTQQGWVSTHTSDGSGFFQP